MILLCLRCKVNVAYNTIINEERISVIVDFVNTSRKKENPLHVASQQSGTYRALENNLAI